MMYEEDDIHDDDSDDDDMMIPTHLSSKESAAFRRVGFRGKWLGRPRPGVYERLIIFTQSTHTGRTGCAPCQYTNPVGITPWALTAPPCRAFPQTENGRIPPRREKPAHSPAPCVYPKADHIAPNQNTAQRMRIAPSPPRPEGGMNLLRVISPASVWLSSA